MALTVLSSRDPLYTVSDPVGRNMTNRLDDVMLVQYFLSLALKPGRKPDGVFLTGHPYGPPIQVDGHYGAHTHYWSLYFCGTLGKDYGADFDVLAAFDNHIENSETEGLRMEMLMECAKLALGPREFALLPNSNRVPPVLRAALSKNATIAAR